MAGGRDPLAGLTLRSRGALAIAFVVAGALLPLLPRWIVPLLRPGVRYLESAESLLSDQKAFVLFSVLSTLPFLALAIFAVFHLRSAGSAVLRPRLAAVLAAFIVMFAVGWWCHMPQTAAGVNFAVFAFPIYAAIAGPIAYGISRLTIR